MTDFHKKVGNFADNMCQVYVFDRGSKVYRPCIYKSLLNEIFCKNHLEIYDYLLQKVSPNEIKNLKFCTKCNRHFLGDNDIWTVCIKCQEKDNKFYCKGITKEGLPCSIRNKEHYCKNHLYQKGIDFEKTLQCSDCKRILIESEFINENGEQKRTCLKCRKKSAENNLKLKENKVNCKAKVKNGSDNWTDCPYTVDSNEQYCLNHREKWTIKDEIEERGNRICSLFPRCTQELDKEYKYNTCLICRFEDQESSKKLREKKKETIALMTIGSDQSICRECLSVFDIFQTKSGNKPTLCEKHYSNQCKIEENRGPRVRDWKKEFENNPERAEKRREWKELNWDKCIGYWQAYRERQKELKGIDQYRKDQAEAMAIWREKNPEKMQLLYKMKKNDPYQRYLSMINQAIKKECFWKLDEAYALKMINSLCFYCNEKIEGIANSIDKLDDKGHYTYDNTVSCCKTCNFMKKEYSIFFFLDKTTNILEFMKDSFESSLDNGLFDITENELIEFKNKAIIKNGTKNINYNNYLNSAIERNIKFKLTKEDFNNLITQSCYLCGNKGSSLRPNGIDRFDNTKGYTLNNCKPCCSACNYFKRDHEFDFFLDHLKKLFIRKNVILENFFIIKHNPDIKFYNLNDEELEKLRSNIDKAKAISIYNEDLINRENFKSTEAKNRKTIPLIKKVKKIEVNHPSNNSNKKTITFIESSNKPLSPQERKLKSYQNDLLLIGEDKLKRKNVLFVTASRQKKGIKELEDKLNSEKLTEKEIKKFKNQLERKYQKLKECEKEIAEIDEIKIKALQQVEKVSNQK